MSLGDLRVWLLLWRRLNFRSHKNRRIGAVAGNWLAQTETHSVAPSNGSEFWHAIITLFSHYKIIIIIIIIIITDISFLKKRNKMCRKSRRISNIATIRDK
jgi:hypothetical protein